ncbi:MAG: ThuA domain-containing protein [Phycisphaerae bacterium]|jgi:type 1 glutamine amidotransferase|nr:ThuA domain-containing protein [Phycisphaerae bacterium]
MRKIGQQSATKPLWACLVTITCLALGALAAERIPKPGKITPPTKQWISKVRQLAPAKATVTPKAKRKVLVFSVATGYQHACIPHVIEVLKVLGAKSGAFEPTFSTDIEMFSPDKIKQFDAVILQNTCSNNPKRNLFLDILTARGRGLTKKLGEKFKHLTPARQAARAAELEKSLLDYVAGGGGLVGIHGAIVTFNTSDRFGDAIGAHFSYHPRSQELTLKPAEPDHPLLKAFGGEPFIHTDECYMMKGKAYAAKNFRPMLAIESKKVKGARKGADEIIYASWIKKYGKGRVFYVSPSHFPHSYHSSVLLRYYLDGIQYALGDLKCDDSPVKK